jgi:hypothetical protein
MPFHFADSNTTDGPLTSPLTSYISYKYNMPQCFFKERSQHQPPHGLLWNYHDFVSQPTSIPDLPLDTTFSGGGFNNTFSPLITLSAMRTDHFNKTSDYLAFKSGGTISDPAISNHYHLDLGTFIVEFGGIRFLVELGAEQYSSSGYFNTKRFTFYRARTEGHNTLAISNSVQDPLRYANQAFGAYVPQTKWFTSPSWSFAHLDMTTAYRYAAVSSVMRGFAFIKLNNKQGGTLPWAQVLVQDEIVPKPGGAVDVVSMFHTSASITIDPTGQIASLTINGSTMIATLLSPPTAKFSVITTDPTPLKLGIVESPNTGIKNLIARPNPGSLVTDAVTLSVLFERAGADYPKPSVAPLSNWPLA